MADVIDDELKLFVKKQPSCILEELTNCYSQWNSTITEAEIFTVFADYIKTYREFQWETRELLN